MTRLRDSVRCGQMPNETSRSRIRLGMQFPMRSKPFLLATSLAVLCGSAFAADTPAKPADAKPAEAKPAAPAPSLPAPTFANVAYGDHERQVLDFYQAKSAKPAPVLFFIHGGGWVTGDKKGVSVKQYLAAGISVV